MAKLNEIYQVVLSDNGQHPALPCSARHHSSKVLSQAGGVQMVL